MKASIILLISLFLLWKFFDRLTIFEFQRGVRFTRGRSNGILEPGIYYFCTLITAVRVIDTRSRFVSITGQEVLSQDGITLRLSLAAQFSIVDPQKFLMNSDNPLDALYLHLQMGLRDLVSAQPVDDLLKQRNSLGPKLLEMTAPRAAELGLSLGTVNLKDLMFPGELKKVFSQVVEARNEGLAALERARGESAALRNLANAARTIEENPGLLQLRILQTMNSSSGNTFILGLPSETALSLNQRPVKGKNGVAST